MEVSGLLSALEVAASAEAEALVRAAAAQAEAIVGEGARRRDLARARERIGVDTALAAALDEAVRSARYEAAAAALRVRQQFLDDVLRRASALLDVAIASDDYQKSLRARLAEALDYVGQKDATVRCTPALVEPLRKLAECRAQVEADQRINDGFEVIAGDLRVDARLSTELWRRWPEFSVALGKIA
jgi:vacuolar-type H+-ATPase subunit E/Vma4